jgi:hypothetical protein
LAQIFPQITQKSAPICAKIRGNLREITAIRGKICANLRENPR